VQVFKTSFVQDCHASSCLVAVPTFKFISPAERYSQSGSEVFVVGIEIIRAVFLLDSKLFIMLAA